MRITLLMMVAFFISSACQSDKKTAVADAVKKENSTVKEKYTLTPFTTSPAFANASIDGMTYKDGKFDFAISGDYQLGEQTSDATTKMCANSGKGQHIHLIVDNSPYAAKYVSSFEHEVSDGEHYLLAFLSRSYHESIKSPSASVAVKTTTKGGSFGVSVPVKDPMLFYSRPKGTYVGKADTKKVMLDFFLKNVDLGSGYTVKADINGEIHNLSKWQPYYIEGLPMGENKITLTLLKDGAVVQTPLNPVTRVFTLKADPAEAG